MKCKFLMNIEIIIAYITPHFIFICFHFMLFQGPISLHNPQISFLIFTFVPYENAPNCCSLDLWGFAPMLLQIADASWGFAPRSEQAPPWRGFASLRALRAKSCTNEVLSRVVRVLRGPFGAPTYPHSPPSHLICMRGFAPTGFALPTKGSALGTRKGASPLFKPPLVCVGRGSLRSS